MKDMVTNGTGNSRYLKSSLASGTSWADALAMLRAGTFPIDLAGLNNGGITQVGSAYSKANVLPDDVCALLGLDSTTAEPKDAFGVVGNPAELWAWEKFAYTSAYLGQSEAYPQKLLIDVGSGNFGSSYYCNFRYSDSVTVSGDGTVSLVHPSIVRVYKRSATTAEGATTLVGKYFQYYDGNRTTDFDTGDIYYWPTSATLDYTTAANRILVTGVKKINGVSERDASLENFVSYESAADSTAYPVDGRSGDYWYIRMGQIGEGMTKIESGTYVGTGTYGSSNPNSLTFGFAPKVVFIYPEEPSQNAAGVVAVYGTIYAMDYATHQAISIIWSDKQMSWYSSSTPIRQFNDTDVKYIYVAIG